MKLTWFWPDTREILGGELYIYIPTNTAHRGTKVAGYAAIRDRNRGWHVLSIVFEPEDEVPNLQQLMQTMLHAAEIKLNDWKEKNDVAV